MQSIADIRKDYTRATLDITSVESDPVKQFQKWINEAITAGVPEPSAMNLSTVTKDGRPSSRIMLLKGIENNMFVFFTNYGSDKGQALDANPVCALTFFWPELERQVRVEGIASRVDDKRAEEYFQSRPRASQIGAWASPQSTIIGDRSILEERVKQMEERFKGIERLPKPKQWGGFQVEPYQIEFWQGRASRLHDRIRFTKVDGNWSVHRLSP